MFGMILILILFFSSPFLLVALALKLWWIAASGLGLALFYLTLFFVNGFSEFMVDLRASAVGEDLNRRLQKLWSQAGLERVAVRFWIYPSPEIEFKTWVKSDRKLEIFFSQGLMQLATDSGLRAAFGSVGELKLSETRLQNRLHAVKTRLERFKGPKEDFRYWFLSFWFYPLERLLNIARI